VLVQATAATSITGIPASSFTFTTAPTGSLYLAYYNGTAWVSLAGPGTAAAASSGTTVSFAAVTLSPAVSLATGGVLYLAVYNGAPLTVATPSPSPAASVAPSTSPSTSPTTSPSTAPSSAASPTIVNGNFATGDLTGWTPCSFAYTWIGQTNASPAPISTGAPSNLGPYAAIGSPAAAVVAPPPSLNLSTVAAPSVLGAYVAQVGSPVSETSGVGGICQTITVNAASPYLSFYVFEAGSETNTKYATQEVDVLNAGATARVQPLFVELNCFRDPGVVGNPIGTVSGTKASDSCIPAEYGGTGTYQATDPQGGNWVQRGPYDLSTYAGTQITLFFGVWDADSYTNLYGNGMFVGAIQMTSSSTFPTSFSPSAIRRSSTTSYGR
jgi:hypothetical protein